jgi:hypothetical protein
MSLFCFLDRAFFNDEENNQQNALINSSVNVTFQPLHASAMQPADGYRQAQSSKFKVVVL